jgi:hypothetical protein
MLLEIDEKAKIVILCWEPTGVLDVCQDCEIGKTELNDNQVLSRR